MRTRTLTVAVMAAAVLGLASCSSSGGSGSDTAPAAGTAPSAAASATASGAATPTDAAPTGPKPAQPSDAGLPPLPDAAATAKLVAALNAIDPAIAKDPAKAVASARTQCQAVYHYPKDHDRLLRLTQQTFTSPDHPQGFGPEKSERILAAVQAGLCPGAR
ncbi:hypothetical protein [Kitasatospora paranensis]|uniref:DUF732 domain-containing protein n=1 Tax=Kitasatospora paranensis TaxID=258053 RepID=A0ABW2G0F5_9ACTN